MFFKACIRSALGVIGLWIALAAPNFAAPTGDTADTGSSASATGAPIALNRYVRHGVRHATRNGHQKSSKTAARSTKQDGSQASEERKSTGMADAVANAKAEMASTSPVAADQSSASETSAANPVPQNPAGSQDQAAPTPWPSEPSASSENSTGQPSAQQTQVVASDELNDIDRAAENSSPTVADNKPALTLAMVSAEPPASSFSFAAFLGNGSSTTLDRTSLIGKIFIGFGALLTMASAARMFMA